MLFNEILSKKPIPANIILGKTTYRLVEKIHIIICLEIFSNFC